MSQRYQLSGSVPLTGLMLILCWSPVAALVLGAVYAVAQYWIPVVQLCVFVTIFYGVAMHFVGLWLAHRGHLRNAFVTGAVTLFAGLLGYYVVWGTHLLLNAGVPANGFMTAFRPDLLLDYVQWGYENGFWGIGRAGNGNVSGIPLAIVWICEFVIIAIAPAFTVYRAMRDKVYCEECTRWVDYASTGRVRELDPTGVLEDRVRAGDWQALAAAPYGNASVPHLRMSVARCEECNDLAVLTVSEVRFEANKKGEVEEKARVIVAGVEIAPADADALAVVPGEVVPEGEPLVEVEAEDDPPQPA